MKTEHKSRLHANNFDLLRLLFAGTVCLVHAAQLSQFEELRWIERFLSSEIAVKAFFVVSGFLIFMSYERSQSIRSYAAKRIRRIYPAYFFVVVLCAFGLACITSKNLSDYFSIAWIKYSASNLVFLNFLQPTLPGVFEKNHVVAVNGALWTLKIEVMFYLSVPLFAYLFRRLSTLSVLTTTYLLSVAYTYWMHSLASRTGNPIYVELARQLPGQLCYFVAGAFYYYYLPLLEKNPGKLLLASALTLAVNAVHPLLFAEPLALATLVSVCALFGHVGNFGKYGDFSYGVYITHFPLIQFLLTTSILVDRPWEFLTLVISLTGISAITLWHLVEKRFLLRGSHYIEPSLLNKASGL